MINQTLLWLLALPVILALVIFILRRNYEDAWVPCVAFAFIGLLVTSGIFFISKGGQTSDVEIWNGKVVSKDRKHGTYEESYECNCRNVTSTYTETVYSTDSKGKTTSRQVTKTKTEKICDTCYRTHYTVKWTCTTTVGGFLIDSEDSLTRLVYNTPNPPRYTIIKEDDPVSRTHPYTNYIQAVPNSLFAPASADLKAKFASLLPKYPDHVYDIYHVDRFLTPGWAPADAKQWNADISMALREIGPAKQVNLIVVIAKTSDANYEYALRDYWEGVNKNDVVVLIGSTAYPKIDFVRIISWTKNEIFKVELRDQIQAKGVINRDIVQMSAAQISKNFERRHMREFEYLDGEIDPPQWIVFTILFLIFGGAGALWWFLPDLVGNGKMRRGISRRYT